MNPDGTVSIFAAGLNGPEGLAFDQSGNLFVACAGNNTISKVTPDGNVKVTATELNYDRRAAVTSEETTNWTLTYDAATDTLTIVLRLKRGVLNEGWAKCAAGAITRNFHFEPHAVGIIHTVSLHACTG